MKNLLAAVTNPARDPAGSLRLLLRVDGLTCAALAGILLASAGPLARLTGLPTTLLLWAGAILVLATVVLFAAASRRPPSAGLVWLVTAINIGWVLASVAVLVLAPGLTGIGHVLVIAQALPVMLAIVVELRALACLQASPGHPAASTAT